MAKEKILSSKSSLYYRHYKAYCLYCLISSVQYAFVNLVLKISSPLEHWYYRVLVILEKFKGVIDVTKLQAILLLEENFNALYKIIFNTRVILAIEK